MNVSRWTRLMLFLGGAMGAPTWGGDCLMYMYDPAHTGYTAEELPSDLALYWKFTTGEDDRHSAPPVVYGDRVFYCANGVVYALDAQTGSIQWRYPKEVEQKESQQAPAAGFMPGMGAGMGAGGLGRMAPSTSTSAPVDRLAPIRVSPALDPEGRVLYVGADDGSLYALNTQNGKLLREFKAGGGIRSAPTLEDGILYFGANDRHIYAVDAKSLELAWQEPMYVGDIVNQPLCLTPDSIVFTTASGTTFVVDRKTLQLRWRQRFGYSLAPPIAAGDLIYVAADGEVQARRRKSESLGWKFPTPSKANIMASLSLGHGSLYVASQDSFVYVLRSEDGTELWRQSTGMDPDVWAKLKASWSEEVPGGGAASWPPEMFERVKGYRVRAAPIISGKDLWIGTEGGFLVRLNALTGEPQWLYKLSPEETTGEGAAIYNVLAPPVVANGALYVCTDDSTLYCFRPEAVDVGAPRVRDEQIITKARDDSEIAVPIYEQKIVEQFPEDKDLHLQLRSQYPFRFYAVLSDEGSGIRQASLEVRFDGQRIEALKYNTATGELVAELLPPPPPGSRVQPQLADGDHTIQLKVSDWHGNTATRTWQFQVDNALPPLEPAEKTERTGLGQGAGQGLGQGTRQRGTRGRSRSGQGGGMGGMGPGGGMGGMGGMGGGRMY